MTKTAFFALAVLLWAGVATGQQADPLLEDHRQRALEERTNALGTMVERGATPDPGPAQARGGPCFSVDTITIEGVTLFPPAQIEAMTAPYAGRCLEGADIQALIRGLNALYADRGYITSRSYIPAQNLGGGSLILSVLEGRVEDIFLVQSGAQVTGPRAERLLGSAFPKARGGLFQLRDFEQGLDQMNRLRSVEATLQLQPGAEPGGSFVVVQREQADRFRGWLRFDDLGGESTGRNRISLDLELDDMLGWNDNWGFGYTGSQNTNALSLYGSVPRGYWTFGMSAGYSEYLTPLSPSAELFGTTIEGGIEARRMLKRDQFTTTEARVALNLRRADRFVNAARLTPQVLSTFEIGATHMRLSAGARNSFDATLRFGLDAFGANSDDPTAVAGTPQAQFAALSFGWQRQGALGSLGTMVNDLRGQLSADALYGSEQIAFGSYSTVRGYSETAAAGDSGVYIRNDLYLDQSIWSRVLPEKIIPALAGGFQPHLFLDMGVAWDRGRHSRETAAGAGLGISWFSDRITLGGLIGVPMIDENHVKIGDPLMQVRLDVKGW
ncbi:ShlB/FhaC/HecB family hemolysin secretion/activation protein [Thioclava sp. GXIMD4216]|uniref:ShlB/FhaC/HecB family hemolysin secretion/activation protein n=1 Tax=Thioclava sp. GXIMD4216 TaxID=3131929 RepID=UPI0030CB7AF1